MMDKKLFLYLALFACVSVQVAAQTDDSRKWNAGVALFLNDDAGRADALAKSYGYNSAAATLGVIIECSDAGFVAETIEALGGTATVISETIVTAELTKSCIVQVAALEEVQSMEAARKHRPTVSDARTYGNVDKIHKATGLETPFTGKGVILGVVDQGFEYRHRAFLDENGALRVRALWVRNSSSGAQALPITDPSRIPDSGDGLNTGGHGTHVANIAAGSKWDGHELYGVAPDAELIIIPSTFEDDKVIEEVRYIKNFAEDEGKPWVANLSFGSHIGPHDGTTLADKTLSRFCEDGGGLIVAAMGNEGDEKIHVQHTFKEAGTVTLLLSKAEMGQNYFNIWEQTGDGKMHLTVKPFVYNTMTQARDYKNAGYWRTNLSQTSTIDKQNNKENHLLAMNTGSFLPSALFGVEVTGTKGASFHAWSNGAIYGEFVNPNGDASTLKGDSQYTVGEGTAAVPAAIAVGAYTSSTNWVAAVNGQTYNYEDPTLTTRGKICYFSSYGPSLDANIVKPTILAPGSAVKSAVSQYSPGFSTGSTDIVKVVRSGVKNYYYAAMAGTSMASPFVAGVMALWLEAYPALKYTEAIEILKSTASKDTYTGREEWNAHSGYGKINAYEGLKEVLKLAESTGINDLLNDEQPLTLSKEENRWRILFNTNESYADIALYDMSGRLVQSQHINEPRRGTEAVVSLMDLTPGTYIINVSTTKNSTTRKIVKQ